MKVRWEYARIYQSYDPGGKKSAHAYLLLPCDTEWKDLGEMGDVFFKITELGNEGWELIGPPHDVNTVFTYKAANDTWHDRAHWIEREYWFKRLVGDE